MKPFISIVFLLWGSILHAQPTITASILFGTGDSMPVQYFTQLGTQFDAGPAGANVTWDFRNVSPSGTPFSWEVKDPSATFFSNQFPGATHAVEAPSDTSVSTFYYQASSDALRLLGFANTFGSPGQQDTFRYDFTNDPYLEMAFPFTYQDQFTDQAMGQAFVRVGGNTLVLDRTQDRKLTGDGHGTLQTPLGSFQNVLRVRMEEDVTDRIMGFPSGSQTNVRYFWYTPDEKYLLMQMDSLVLNTPAGNFPSYVMFYRSGSVISHIGITLAQQMGLQVYPNPLSDQSVVTFSLEEASPITLSITNLKGQLITSQELGTLPTGPQKFSLGDLNLPKGMLAVQVSTPAGKAVQLVYNP